MAGKPKGTQSCREAHRTAHYPAPGQFIRPPASLRFRRTTRAGFPCRTAFALIPQFNILGQVLHSAEVACQPKDTVIVMYPLAEDAQDHSPSEAR